MMSNTAFYSVSQAVLADQLQAHSRSSADAYVLTQLVKTHTTHLSTSTAPLTLLLGDGVPPGSSVATDAFNFVYVPLAEAIVSSQVPGEIPILAYSHLDGEHRNCSTPLFVDDLARRMASHCNHRFAQRDEFDSRTVDLQMCQAGMARNRDKADCLPSFCGPGAHSVLRDSFNGNAIPGVTKHARYLGPRLSWNTTCSFEVKLRLQAARVAWHQFKSFWHKPVSLKLKVLVFKPVVLASLLTGMVALAPSH